MIRHTSNLRKVRIISSIVILFAIPRLLDLDEIYLVLGRYTKYYYVSTYIIICRYVLFNVLNILGIINDIINTSCIPL